MKTVSLCYRPLVPFDHAPQLDPEQQEGLQLVPYGPPVEGPSTADKLAAELEELLEANETEAVEGGELEQAFRVPTKEDRCKTMWGTWTRLKREDLRETHTDPQELDKKAVLAFILQLLAAVLLVAAEESNCDLSLLGFGFGIWEELCQVGPDVGPCWA